MELIHPIPACREELDAMRQRPGALPTMAASLLQSSVGRNSRSLSSARSRQPALKIISRRSSDNGCHPQAARNLVFQSACKILYGYMIFR
mmetsp:Transcript_12916/g.25252  ORF Transcript_12916/g.25252 Transcript_12916/m.25252 type:complete len:90 (-) Transcript_12916:298-567(-)